MSNIRKIGVLDTIVGVLALLSLLFDVGVIRRITANMQNIVSRIGNFVALFLKYSPHLSAVLLIFTGIILIGYNVVLR